MTVFIHKSKISLKETNNGVVIVVDNGDIHYCDRLHIEPKDNGWNFRLYMGLIPVSMLMVDYDIDLYFFNEMTYSNIECRYSPRINSVIYEVI